MFEQLTAMPKYEAYKDSGVEWLGEIPAHWKVKKLKYESDVVLGKMLCTENKGNYQLKPYLKSKNIQWLNVDTSSVDEMWFSPAEMEMYRLRYGDLILSEGGEVGKTCIWSGELEECYIQNSAQKVTFSKQNNSRFFLYLFFIAGKIGLFDSIVNRVSIAHLTRDKLTNIDFVFPPLLEQTAIATYLDRKTAQLDQAVATKEKQIALLKERKQILIQNAVTQGINPDAPTRDSGVEWISEIPAHWEVKKLSHVAQIDSGATPDRSRQDFWNGKIPWVKTGEINYNEILETEEHITESGLRNSSTKLSPKGTLLMAMYGQGITRGRVALLGVPATYNQACCAIQFNKLFMVKFAFYFFIAAYPYIRDDGNETSQMNLSTGYISTLKIVCPPWEEQNTIVTHIETESAKIDRAISLQQQQIDKLKEYKATLINSAVTGKIRVPALVESSMPELADSLVA
jgi:type I restriction enzyme S subunit